MALGRPSLASGSEPVASVGPAVEPVSRAASVAKAVDPPVPVSTTVTYPGGARGRARVLLELVVSPQGAVTEARIVSGLSPFVEHAQRAARRFLFQPARQGGVATAARIRFEVVFEPPPPERPASPPQVLPEPPPAAPLAEVRVLGKRPSGSHSFGGAQARQLPGALGDPLRAIAMLPGVAPLVSGLPLFFVRGAPPGNLGFFVDGIEIPLLYHAFLGPSVLHPAAIDRVTLHAGGYPAALGRFAGGVVSADLMAPSDVTRGEWSVRLLDTGAFLETPLFGGRGSLLLGGRYSYTALVASLVTDLELNYWDYMARLSYDISERDTVSLFAFGAYDFFRDSSDPDAQPGDRGNGVRFHRVDLRYDRQLGAASDLRLALTWGTDRSQSSQGFISNSLAGARFLLNATLSKNVELRAGVRVQLDDYELEIARDTRQFADVSELFPTREEGEQGAHVELSFHLGPRLTLTPGLRVDRYVSIGDQAWGVEPRLSSRVRLNSRIDWVQTFGLAHQQPNFVPALPGLSVAGFPSGLQRSVQSSGGVEATLSPFYFASVTAFNNVFLRLTDPVSFSQSLDLDADTARLRALGSGVGLEFILRRRMHRRFGGMLSYTLSRVRRRYDRIASPGGYERPHVLALAGTYRLGADWFAGARGVAYSGVLGSRIERGGAVYDQSRSKPFARLDFRAQKRFPLGEGKYWAVTAEVLNGTLSREVLRRTCEADAACEDEVVGPLFLPSLGLEGRF